MRLRPYLMAALFLAVCPAAAAAQSHVTPFVSGVFGGSSGQSLSIGDDADSQGWGFGVNAGRTFGWAGVEADVAHFPRFFDSGGGFMTNSSLTTAMGNLRVGIPLSMGMGKGAMPFVSAGIGAIRPNVTEAGNLASTDETKFGWNAGVGLAGYFSDHVGLEGDVRYFRATEKADATNPFGIDFDGFDFWRAGIGLSFKW